KGHILGCAQRRSLLDQSTERESHPGNHQRPSFDATVAIDALFERSQLHDGVDVQLLGFGHQAFERDAPRARAELRRKSSWLVLISAELVIIVVVGDVLEGGRLLCSAE